MRKKKRYGIFKLARKLNVPLKDRPKKYLYDGKTISTRQNESNLLHDIAHYVVCREIAPDGLMLPEFGLGPAPDTLLKMPKASKIHSREKCYEQECLASALGILFERYLKYPWQESALAHSWINQNFNHTQDQNLEEYQKRAISLLPDNELKLALELEREKTYQELRQLSLFNSYI